LEESTVRTKLPLVAEHIEREASIEIVNALSPRDRNRFGVALEVIDGTTLVTATSSDSYFFNRALSLGLTTVATRATVERVVERLAARAKRYLVHVPPQSQPAEIETWLHECGLTRYTRAWWKLVARLPLTAGTEPSAITRATSANVQEVASVLGGVFGIGELGVTAFSSLIDRPGWYVYRAEADGETAGGAILFVRGAVGYLMAGGILARFRRRGLHRALLARRARDAHQLGCQLLVSETGEDLPGEHGPSLKNLGRLGLQPIYLRPNFAPAGMARFSG
jgi:hypothetical protein